MKNTIEWISVIMVLIAYIIFCTLSFIALLPIMIYEVIFNKETIKTQLKNYKEVVKLDILIN